MITQNIYKNKSKSFNTKYGHYKTITETMALYDGKTVALNIKVQLEELKKEGRKILRRILGSRKTI